MRVKIIGKTGKIGSVLIEHLRSYENEIIICENNPDVIVTTAPLHVTKEIIKDNKDKIIIDFIGVNKIESRSSYSLLKILNNEIKTRKYYSTPGCFASSVFLPLYYLIHNYEFEIESVFSTSIGGRSTVGKNGFYLENEIRLSSKESSSKHQLEVESFIENVSPIHMSILVGDFESGITTISYIKLKNDTNLIKETNISYNIMNNEWKVMKDTGGTFNLNPSLDAIFQISTLDKKTIKVVTKLNNLSFPVKISVKILSQLLKEFNYGTTRD
jgi:N-acetyl-gamma-glutamylphosphate reductase